MARRVLILRFLNTTRPSARATREVSATERATRRGASTKWAVVPSAAPMVRPQDVLSTDRPLSARWCISATARGKDLDAPQIPRRRCVVGGRRDRSGDPGRPAYRGAMPSAFLHPVRQAHPGARSSRIVRGEGRSFSTLTAASTSTAWPASGTAPWATGATRSPMPSGTRPGPWRRTRHSIRSPTNRPNGWPNGSATSARCPTARVFFTVSGSEAIDTVMKLARLAHLLAGHPSAS